MELASDFPSSAFWGFDPGPAARIGANKAAELGLRNLSIHDLNTIAGRGPYDLIIASHVLEHLLDFELLRTLNTMLAEDGLLYVEVPNPLRYQAHKRQEFLYYFDRLHVNHFTPQSLARLAADYEFGYIGHFEYAFPYREGDDYPAMGMLFKKGQSRADICSPSILEAAKHYVAEEKQRAKSVAAQFDAYECILVWGAGDNFFRSIDNGGPLSSLRDMVVLDRRPQEIAIGGRKYTSENPEKGIRRYPWPVAVTIADGRKSILEQIRQIDPRRPVFFV